MVKFSVNLCVEQLCFGDVGTATQNRFWPITVRKN